jgi:hypothetical protein
MVPKPFKKPVAELGSPNGCQIHHAARILILRFTCESGLEIERRGWCDEWWDDDVWYELGFGVAWDLVGQEPQKNNKSACQCVTKARQGKALLGRSQSLRSLDKGGWRGSRRGTLWFVGSWWCLEAHCGAVYMFGKLGILSPTLLHCPFEIPVSLVYCITFLTSGPYPLTCIDKRIIWSRAQKIFMLESRCDA